MEHKAQNQSTWQKIISAFTQRKAEQAAQAYVDSIESMINHILQSAPKHVGEVAAVICKHKDEYEKIIDLLKPILADLQPIIHAWSKDLHKADIHNNKTFEQLTKKMERLFK